MPRSRLYIVFACLAILLIGIAACVHYRVRQTRRLDDGIYGIFLTNGQVYFGTVEQETRKDLVLRHIFYIQVKNPSDVEVSTAVSSDAALLKLGNELHGPEDWMRINQDHVLFIEKLKQDSKVSQAIRDYEAKTPATPSL